MAYDKQYFDWQRNVGNFGGIVNVGKFSPYIKTDDAVLEFGCGGGYLLKNLRCKSKIGIEINPTARKNAEEFGLSVFEDSSAVPDDYADIVISNHALEHVDNPVSTLQGLYPKIKSGGKLVFIVPHEKASEKWHSSDINQHLYTWNQMTLGNLFQRAGYTIASVAIIWHRWPPKHEKIYRILGKNLFHYACVLEAVRTRKVQIRVIATKIH
jgi:SAM-dependent methyltransferase